MPAAQQVWKVKSNGFIFPVNEQQLEEANIIQTSPTVFNCLKNSRSINASIVEADMAAKKITVDIEGSLFEVEIKDALDQMLDEMGFSVAAARQVKDVKAPMPGMVLEIMVAEGQEIKEGDKLLILGAMKMENSITVNTNAKIKRIAVKAGQAVEKGQVLLELE